MKSKFRKIGSELKETVKKHCVAEVNGAVSRTLNFGSAHIEVPKPLGLRKKKRKDIGLYYEGTFVFLDHNDVI